MSQQYVNKKGTKLNGGEEMIQDPRTKIQGRYTTTAINEKNTGGFINNKNHVKGEVQTTKALENNENNIGNHANSGKQSGGL